MNKKLTLFFLYLFASLGVLGSLSYLDFFNRFILLESKWQWMDQKIHLEKNQNYDMAFIGSSFIWCNVETQQLATDLGIKTINLGRKWRGRDADYVVFQHLVENHNVKSVVFELVSHERDVPHQAYRFITRPLDAFDELYLAKPSFTSLKTSLESFLEILAYSSLKPVWSLLVAPKMGNLCTSPDCLANNKNTGVYIYSNDEQRDTAMLQDFTRTPHSQHESVMTLNPTVRSDYFLKKIKTLAEIKNIKVYFLITPFLGYERVDEKLIQHYSQFGTPIDLLSKIQHLTQDSKYWFDPYHLYNDGRAEFSRILAHYIQETGVLKNHDFKQTSPQGSLFTTQ